MEHPLPMPKWKTRIQKPYKIDNVDECSKLCWQIETVLQNLLEELNYNTVDNLLDFYRAYKKLGNGTLVEFFRSYSPPICLPNVTCVGLALELWNRLHKLDESFPNLSEHFFVASCEENIESFDEYLSNCEYLEAVADTLEKEHVLLALKIQIGDRDGVMLCDPGYHVGRVIAVMKDGNYPHTGRFVQSDESNARKEYNYQFSNSGFIEWQDRTIRNNGKSKEVNTALIHVSRAYVTAVDVTERRNLVYNFRSLLSRDSKGRLMAGIYFKIKESERNNNHHEFTLFYTSHGKKKRAKMNFGNFSDQDNSDMINRCNEQLNLPTGALTRLLSDIGNMLNDSGFVEQMLRINNAVGMLAEHY